MRASRIDRIRQELEDRGVGPDLSRVLSKRLAGLTEALSPDEYDAMLSGVIMAYGVQHQQDAEPADAGTDFDEVHRLLGAFTTELQKLEEALETLAAYVTRIRVQTGPPPGHTLQ